MKRFAGAASQVNRIATKLFGMAIAAVLLLSGCMSTESAGTRARGTSADCFFARALSDWRPLDDSNLIIFVSGRRPYHVELVRPAMNLSGNVQIGVYDRDGRVCAFGGDAIIVDGFMPERIAIRSIRELTDDELQVVYARFGISPPIVVETESVELPPPAD